MHNVRMSLADILAISLLLIHQKITVVLLYGTWDTHPAYSPCIQQRKYFKIQTDFLHMLGHKIVVLAIVLRVLTIPRVTATCVNPYIWGTCTALTTTNCVCCSADVHLGTCCPLSTHYATECAFSNGEGYCLCKLCETCGELWEEEDQFCSGYSDRTCRIPDNFYQTPMCGGRTWPEAIQPSGHWALNTCFRSSDFDSRMGFPNGNANLGYLAWVEAGNTVQAGLNDLHAGYALLSRGGVWEWTCPPGRVYSATDSDCVNARPDKHIFSLHLYVHATQDQETEIKQDIFGTQIPTRDALVLAGMESRLRADSTCNNLVNSIHFDLEYSFGSGTLRISDLCTCMKGFGIDSITGGCVPCASGYYNDQYSVGLCKECVSREACLHSNGVDFDFLTQCDSDTIKCESCTDLMTSAGETEFIWPPCASDLSTEAERSLIKVIETRSCSAPGEAACPEDAFGLPQYAKECGNGRMGSDCVSCHLLQPRTGLFLESCGFYFGDQTWSSCIERGAQCGTDSFQVLCGQTHTDPSIMVSVDNSISPQLDPLSFNVMSPGECVLCQDLAAVHPDCQYPETVLVECGMYRSIGGALVARDLPNPTNWHSRKEDALSTGYCTSCNNLFEFGVNTCPSDFQSSYTGEDYYRISCGTEKMNYGTCLYCDPERCVLNQSLPDCGGTSEGTCTTCTNTLSISGFTKFVDAPFDCGYTCKSGFTGILCNTPCFQGSCIFPKHHSECIPPYPTQCIDCPNRVPANSFLTATRIRNNLLGAPMFDDYRIELIDQRQVILEFEHQDTPLDLRAQIEKDKGEAFYPETYLQATSTSWHSDSAIAITYSSFVLQPWPQFPEWGPSHPNYAGRFSPPSYSTLYGIIKVDYNATIMKPIQTYLPSSELALTMKVSRTQMLLPETVNIQLVLEGYSNISWINQSFYASDFSDWTEVTATILLSQTGDMCSETPCNLHIKFLSDRPTYMAVDDAVLEMGLMEKMRFDRLPEGTQPQIVYGECNQ